MSWLAGRQSVTASNIANADTPGYRAREVEQFSAVLDSTPLTLTTTSLAHLQVTGGSAVASAEQAGGSWDTAHSGNSISIEKELMDASANSRWMNLDIGLTRSFHRMFLTSVKV